MKYLLTTESSALCSWLRFGWQDLSFLPKFWTTHPKQSCESLRKELVTLGELFVWFQLSWCLGCYWTSRVNATRTRQQFTRPSPFYWLSFIGKSTWESWCWDISLTFLQALTASQSTFYVSLSSSKLELVNTKKPVSTFSILNFSTSLLFTRNLQSQLHFSWLIVSAK